MHIAYVAGPYRDPGGVHFVLANIARARGTAVWLWQSGFAVVCPHLNSALMDGICPDSVFLDGAIEIMLRCDLLVTTGDYTRSEGTMAEIAAARAAGIPVYNRICDYETLVEIGEGRRGLLAPQEERTRRAE